MTGARVAWWIEHPQRMDVAQSLGLLAVPFLIGGVAVMVALTRRYSRGLSSVAAVALTLAMTGLAAVHGLELASRGAAVAGNPHVAVKILDDAGLGIPAIVLIVMFLGGVLVGTLSIYAAMWRSPYVPRLAVVLGAAFVVLDIGAGQGVISHVAALGSGLVLAWASLTEYAGRPRRQRYRSPH